MEEIKTTAIAGVSAIIGSLIAAFGFDKRIDRVEERMGKVEESVKECVTTTVCDKCQEKNDAKYMELYHLIKDVRNDQKEQLVVLYELKGSVKREDKC